VKQILKTNDDVALTVARIAMGVVMFPHGAQKMLGWWGGHGFTATMESFTQQMGIPAPLAFLALFAEFFGALGLIFGFLTRPAAFGVFATMLVAMFKVGVPNGFFMNWFGNQKGEGIEFFLLTFGLLGASMIRGAGAFSVDGWIAKRLGEKKPNAKAIPHLA